jgi:hypothetical protein
MQLVKNISANILDNADGSVVLIKSLKAEVQQEDYINMNGFIAYLQDLKKTEFTEGMAMPTAFGLKNKYNIPLVTLNIDY